MEAKNAISQLDDIDLAILAALEADGRMSTVELARQVGLSPTPCHRRVRRMEQLGVISGYAAIIDPAALGRGMSAIVSVNLSRQLPEDIRDFHIGIAQCPEIAECLLVAGEVDYMLRVAVADTAALRDFILHTLKPIDCIATTSTILILETHQTNAPPVAS